MNTKRKHYRIIIIMMMMIDNNNNNNNKNNNTINRDSGHQCAMNVYCGHWYNLVIHPISLGVCACVCVCVHC